MRASHSQHATTGRTAAPVTTKPKTPAPEVRPKGFGTLPKTTQAPEGFGAPARQANAALTGAPKTDHVAGNLTATVTGPNVTHKLSTRAAFDRLADQATGAGAAGMPEVKFLLDRETGELYFLPKEIKYHYFFARDVLGVTETLEEFNQHAYLDPNRRYVAGTVTAYDNFVGKDGKKGTLGLSFWSTDIVRAPLLKEAYAAVSKGLAFAKTPVVYHPGGQTQENLLEKDSGADKKALAAAKIPVLTNTELAKGFDFSALNPGVSFGKLRVIHGNGAGEPSPTRHEVAIYADELPAELPPVAGVATPKPQTYLSHVALKARQDDTPYAYARDILKDPKVKALEGKMVRFEVTPKGYVIREATKAEATTFFESLRPKKNQKLKSDLTEKSLGSLDKIGFEDSKAYGSKAANVAELLKLSKSGALNVNGPGEPKVITPDGFALPASWYDTFMKTAKYDATHTFEQRLTQMLADPEFKSDPVRRADMLDDFQDEMEDAAMPPALQKQVDELQKKFKAKFPNEAGIRLRSSSNSEDVEGFNGAGLFDSYTFRFANADQPGRSLGDRLKKVFASVWNERAFSEFDFYRLEPHSVDMAELVTPNEDGEIANGVVRWGGAIPGWDTISVNAQVGESLVTNPDGGATPDSIVMGNYGFNGETEIQYEQETNQKLSRGRKHVLTDAELKTLFKAMKVVQEHFKALYGKQDDPNFAIECEFKIDAQGKLLIKQARPWVS